MEIAMDNTNVSIIIIVRNNNTIFDCINEIISQIESCDEIIVVDDNSKYDFVKTLENYCKENGIVFLQSDIAGNRAHNRNIGANKAKNPILVFVDSDIILNHKSIQSIKTAYKTQDNVAYIGTRCAGRYDPLRMLILGGINVEYELKSQIDCEYLEKLPLIKDKRIKENIYTDSMSEQDFYWTCYFTCCCTVLTDIFKKINGFEEDYIGWGVEDIDLGYRISQHGKIAFLRNFSGVHLPHSRSVIYSEQDNCFNLKRLLKKHQRFDVELVSVYRISARELDKFKTFLNRMRMMNLTNIPTIDEMNVLYVNPISLKNPYGNLLYVDCHGVETKYNLLGISTFFDDNSISKVYISGNIVLYPLSVICGILQECLRIGNNVYLETKFPDFRIDWSDFTNLTLLQPQKRNEYRIHDLVEFNFDKTTQQKYYRVTSDYLTLEDKKIIYPKIEFDTKTTRTIFKKSYCTINLTRGTGYKLLTCQLRNDYKLQFVGIYSQSFSTNTFFNYDQFPKQLYPLLSLHTSILLIVENINQFDFNFSEWEERKGALDLVVDSKGNYFFH